MAIHIHLNKPVARKAKDALTPSIGSKVHMGHVTPGGSGIKGVLEKIEGGVAFVRNAEGKLFRGKLENVTKDSKAKDADRYDPVVERMPVAINGKRYRPKIVKNEASAIWVSSQLFATEQEAMAEAKRQIAKATKDASLSSVLKEAGSARREGWKKFQFERYLETKMNVERGSSDWKAAMSEFEKTTKDALTPEQLRSDAQHYSEMANFSSNRADNRSRHRTAFLAHMRAVKGWEDYANGSPEAKGEAQKKIDEHKAKASEHQSKMKMN